MKKIFKSNRIHLLLIIIPLLVWSSCKVDQISKAKGGLESVKDITGSWKVVKATRNGTDILGIVDTNYINFNKFRVNFKQGSYTLTNPLPFIVTQDGTYSVDDPQYPFTITFKQTGGTSIATPFSYPIVGGVHVLTLNFSPGCTTNAYIYSLQKVN